MEPALMNRLLHGWLVTLEYTCASTETDERLDFNFKGEEKIMTNIIQRKEEERATTTIYYSSHIYTVVI